MDKVWSGLLVVIAVLGIAAAGSAYAQYECRSSINPETVYRSPVPCEPGKGLIDKEEAAQLKEIERIRRQNEEAALADQNRNEAMACAAEASNRYPDAPRVDPPEVLYSYALRACSLFSGKDAQKRMRAALDCANQMMGPTVWNLNGRFVEALYTCALTLR